MRRLALLVPVLALLAVAGCGSSSGGGGGGTVAGPPGKKLFVENGCGSCHQLSAADGQGSFGPNLDALKPSAAQVEAALRQGPGAMPSVEGRLSDADIATLADYVQTSAGA